MSLVKQSSFEGRPKTASEHTCKNDLCPSPQTSAWQDCAITSGNNTAITCTLPSQTAAGTVAVRLQRYGIGDAQHQGTGAPFTVTSQLLLGDLNIPGVSLGGGLPVSLSGKWLVLH